ncbi:MAG TPA: UDP-phosphate N-acetylglucosaminyl 1-phosphate transferase, partial [Polyangiaceae bacterium]|nr:UDP-phosphate N-acetylglucosaminyl 1-phosphate transferase [Polyangiaceae bacterium]
VSIEIYGTFGRYAIGQLRRLEQGMKLASHRGVILDWLREDPTLGLDAVAARLGNKEYVKQLYRSMFDQGLLEANDFASLVRFAKDKSATFELPRELRPKNAYNLVRLLATATGWLRDGAPTFEATGALRDRLLAIKHGEVSLEDVLAEAESMAPELERARDASRLPKRPDVARADALARRIGEEIARRFVTGAPGPFGQDAPEPPVVQWNE